MPPYLRQAAQNLQQIAKSLVGNRFRDHISEIEFRRALLAGYPDRVARRRTGPQKAQMDGMVTLATGHGAVIARESGVHDAEWLIALDVTSGRTSATTQALVRLASRIESDWLTPTHSELRCELDRESGAVKAHEVDWYDEIVLREHPVAVPPADRARVLAEAWPRESPTKTAAG